MIPIGQSNLYVEPIYLQATASPLPELKRVIVAMGNAVVMEPTLSEALARLFGTAAGPPPAPPGAPAVGPPGAAEVAALSREARDRYARALEALRGGDFARFGEELRSLEATLDRLIQATGQP